MPLADIPEGANEEVINRIQNVRGKILQKAILELLLYMMSILMSIRVR